MRLVAILLGLAAVLGHPSSASKPLADAHAVWMTLPEAIRIGLEDQERVGVISTGAHTIPFEGFELTPDASSPLGRVHDDSVAVGPIGPDSNR